MGQRRSKMLSRYHTGERTRRSDRGSALVIVLILLSVMGALIMSNGVVLRRLKVELQMLEEKHKRVLEHEVQPHEGEPPSERIPPSPVR